MNTITVPVYYTQEYKTKPNKTMLVTLNIYRNAHYFLQNNLKRYFSDLIRPMIQDMEPIKGKYKVTYEYYYKNKSSDMPNVTPMVSKWLNDVLQEEGKVVNDNVQFLTEEVHKVAGMDKENPRVEVRILPGH